MINNSSNMVIYEYYIISDYLLIKCDINQGVGLTESGSLELS